jgi:hypothetical protein
MSSYDVAGAIHLALSHDRVVDTSGGDAAVMIQQYRHNSQDGGWENLSGDSDGGNNSGNNSGGGRRTPPPPIAPPMGMPPKHSRHAHSVDGLRAVGETYYEKHHRSPLPPRAG